MYKYIFINKLLHAFKKSKGKQYLKILDFPNFCYGCPYEEKNQKKDFCFSL